MLIDRAQRYIESFLDEPLTLDQIAGDCNVSPFHLTRAFSILTGMPVMRYVWRRRLSRAAESLATQGPSILTTALSAGYQSHEAFTRAFKAAFGLSPNQVRSSGRAPSGLTNPTFMSRTPMPRTLSPPIVEHMPERLIVGPSRRYDMQTRSAIPAQWAAYSEDGTTPPNWIADKWYGVISAYSEADNSFDYLCGVEVTGRGPLPQGQTLIAIGAGNCARFATRDHISAMTSMWAEIYSDWLGQDRLVPRPGPSLEYYPVEFDGRTGQGGYEIWVPIA